MLVQLNLVGAPPALTTSGQDVGQSQAGAASTCASKRILSVFTESVTRSKGLAYFITLVVGCTIFGSVFSMMCGMMFLLYMAAGDLHFYDILAHKNQKVANLPDNSLQMLAFVSTIASSLRIW